MGFFNKIGNNMIVNTCPANNHLSERTVKYISYRKLEHSTSVCFTGVRKAQTLAV